MKAKTHKVKILFIFFVFTFYFLISPLSDDLGDVSRFPNHSMNLIFPFLFSFIILWFMSEKYLSMASQITILFLYVLFIEKICLGSMEISNVESYAVFFLSGLSVFVLLGKFVGTRGAQVARALYVAIFMTIWFMFSILFVYSLKFDTVVTREVFFAIGQTNPSEVKEYINSQVGFTWVLIFLSLNGFAGCLLLWKERRPSTELNTVLLGITALLTVSAVVLLIPGEKNYRLVKFAYAASEEYKDELLLYRQTQEKRKVNPIKSTKSEAGEVYVIVIGESHNKSHMGLYGYLRDTTSGLDILYDEKELLVFDNAFSCHTHTDPVLSLALTEANQYNEKQFYNSASIVGVLKSAEMETFWVSNQVLLGPWDNLVSLMAHEADNLIGLNRGVGKNLSTQKFDGDMLLEVEKIIKSPDEKNKVIFVHLIGSHWDYCNRFPKEFSVYNEDLEKGLFGMSLAGKKNIARSVNCYDNSVVYNDYILSSLVQLLKEQTGVSGLLYMADHSEDVFANRGHEYTRFTFTMTQIPLLGWFSKSYQQRYSDRYAVFAGNTGKIFSNDLLYDTLLGLFNVKTDLYNPVFDLTSDQYSLDKREASFYYKEKKYLSEDNSFYYQPSNAVELIRSEQKDRVIPHRVNSVGKLADVWQAGYRSFEMDVHIRSRDETYLEVGHDTDVMAGKSVGYLLDTIDYTQIQKVLFDIKNVSSDNYEDLLQALGALDNQYTIKEKIILEFQVTDQFVAVFSKEGYRTSYSLPTKKIETLLKQGSEYLMQDFAVEISRLVRELDFFALSYDKNLYPFVVKYLQPLLAESIVYHTRDLSIGLYDKMLIKKLGAAAYHQNKRVETILLSYKSVFDL